MNERIPCVRGPELDAVEYGGVAHEPWRQTHQRQRSDPQFNTYVPGEVILSGSLVSSSMKQRQCCLLCMTVLGFKVCANDNNVIYHLFIYLSIHLSPL